jgi:N-acetylglutamate synthase
MDLPDVHTLYDVIEHTWPAAARRPLGPWTIRDGAGGGKRVSAATGSSADLSAIQQAETAMSALNQPHLFMIRQGDAALDAALARRGYIVVDPVNLYACPITTLSETPAAPMSGFAIWPPLAIMSELWAAGGIDAPRLAVMDRAALPKTSILARVRDRAAGCAFVAIHRQIAMIHAIEVTPTLRRNGAGNNIMRTAAGWAQDQGARYFSLVVTDANAAANALYCQAGLTMVGHYHYRMRQDQ